MSSTVAPYLLAVVATVLVSVPALLLRPYLYSNEGQAPYSDSGFALTPDWSGYATEINDGYALAYVLLLTVYCAVHDRRQAVSRRALMCFTVSEVLQIGQCLCTTFPEPNPKLGAATWCFSMHPLVYSIGLLTVHFYSKFKLLVGVAYILSIFGWCLLIPTRFMYTVDIMSAIIAGVLPFLVYHWYVRTTLSISKRRVLRWLEADALLGCNTFAAVRILQTRNPTPSNRALSSSPLLESSTNFVDRGTHEGSADGGGGITTTISLESPALEFGLEAFRAPTFVGDERRTAELDLLEHARSKTERRRKLFVGTAVVAGIMVAVVGLVGTIIAVDVANDKRPIGVPLADDILFRILPELPDHTADVMLWVQVLLVFFYAIASRSRFIILRRTGIMYGVMLVMRSFTVDATFPPDPSKLCRERTHPAGTTCGDLIFSGHAIAFLCSAFVVRYYVRIWWIEICTWGWTTISLVVVIACRLHYTRDVFTALIVGFCVIHLFHVSIFWRPDRKAKYSVLRWFEFDVSYLLLCSEESEERPRGREGASEGRPRLSSEDLQTLAPHSAAGAIRQEDVGAAAKR